MTIKPVHAVVVLMLAQQALVTMSSLTLPVMAPVVIKALELNPGLLGGYTSAMFGVGMLSTLLTGSLLARYGGIRVSQVCLLLAGVSLAVAAWGHIGGLVLATIFMGAANGPPTPASSHLLARFTSTKSAPLIFSIKQTGVPIGGAIAGVLIPFFVLRLDWQGALLATAVIPLAMVALLQPCRERFDDDRRKAHRISLAGVGDTLKAVLASPPLRELALASFIFSGVQICFGAFFVAYLVDGLGYRLALAGGIFAAAQGTAIVARVLWGWVASRFISARALLGLLCVTMALAAFATGLFTPAWPVLAVGAVALVFGLTGMSYQGVLLAEIVRCAPDGAAGLITSGVMTFTFAGLMLVPAGFGVILGVTGTYGLGFAIGAVPTLLVGVMLLRPARQPAVGTQLDRR